MPKWKISDQFNNSTTMYVTFTANTSIVGYKITAYSFGRTASSAVATISFPNVSNDNGSTATLMCGAPAVGGDCMLFPDDGFTMLANVTTFVTLTMGSAGTGTLAVAYELIPKQP